MPNVDFKVGNQRFDLVCDEGQQDQIKKLAHSLDMRVTELSRNLGSAPDGLLLVVTALMMEDELQNLQKERPQDVSLDKTKNIPANEDVIQIISEVVNPLIEHIEGLAEKIENM